jgi:hypothetical protein
LITQATAAVDLNRCGGPSGGEHLLEVVSSTQPPPIAAASSVLSTRLPTTVRTCSTGRHAAVTAVIGTEPQLDAAVGGDRGRAQQQRHQHGFSHPVEQLVTEPLRNRRIPGAQPNRILVPAEFDQRLQLVRGLVHVGT